MAKAKDNSQVLSPDEQAVADSSLYGGQTALKMTAIVPAIMAAGFLFLMAYFKAKGGYKQITLSAEHEPPAME